MMLYRLLLHMDRTSFEAEVISLTGIGPVGEMIEALGVPVRGLGMQRGKLSPLGFLRLIYWLRQCPPHVIQTWMYHADFAGGLAAKLAGCIPVAWGIRHTNLDRQANKRLTLWTARACAKLSHYLPLTIVCCAEASRRVHQELGYAWEKMVVIPNGFDLEAFTPDPAARGTVRQELVIPEGTLLIGLVGRFDPQKDHKNFIQAASILHTHLPDVHFLLCGNGVTWENPTLTQWIEDAGIRVCCHLLGQRTDIPRLDAALDIAVSSSYGEAFSVAIGEAMACGVPCVVTDVGDSALIVADTGKVVPPKNSQALADAWLELIALGHEGRHNLGLAARRRIEERFSLPDVVARYEQLYKDLAGCGQS